MDTQQLLRWVDQPETHQKVVGEYEGSYALGVTSDPPAFLLRVEPKDIGRFPKSVTLDGVNVPVIVHGGFVQPRHLKG
ncbi:hypothetical protein SAMN05444166_2200 [Singulisphaera sp. GP187]|uniref:hypothetical protein n=1 Tax=Singulisphaera sp. GP187 TaxID=1882752 RepID=UPI0009290429|nr:hypothetical protein [Singulisphaera sp. GP187]SIO04950.1 hypothetical protein SAMN05444166_2200 [Singulisphaera sp. GP187]